MPLDPKCGPHGQHDLGSSSPSWASPGQADTSGTLPVPSLAWRDPRVGPEPQGEMPARGPCCDPHADPGPVPVLAREWVPVPGSVVASAAEPDAGLAEAQDAGLASGPVAALAAVQGPDGSHGPGAGPGRDQRPVAGLLVPPS